LRWHAPKVVRILIKVLESYDFMTLQHHVDPNPTMNPNLVESMLSPDPNRKSYTILQNLDPVYGLSRSWMISWVILLNVVVYYVNLPSHFYLLDNPLFTSQAPIDQPIGSVISLKENLTISNLCTSLTNSQFIIAKYIARKFGDGMWFISI
jgi:hypothetical protein